MSDSVSSLSLAAPVRCLREPAIPGFMLRGAAADGTGEIVTVTFSSPVPADMPAQLAALTLEIRPGEGVKILSGEHGWWLAGAGCFVHREVSAAFYAAIPPRPVPWTKKVFWQLVLALAANPLGRRLLLALRR